MGDGGLHRSLTGTGRSAAVSAEGGDRLPNLVGLSAVRKRLSDITNTASAGTSAMASAVIEEGKFMDVSSKDCVSQLMMENTNLLKLLAEKNKLIELSDIELKKLQNKLHKSNQQNWHLARVNSDMFAELNMRKDRLKALQHELGCMSSLLKIKTSELEEKDNLMKELVDKIGYQLSSIKCEEVEVNASDVLKDKQTSNPNKRRKLKDHSFGSTVLMEQVGNTDGKSRRSLRLASIESESCEIREDLLKIDDVILPMSHKKVLEGKDEGRRSLQAKTLPLKPGSCKSLELDKIDAVMPVSQQVISVGKKAVEIRKSLRRGSSNPMPESHLPKIEDTQFLVFSIKNKDLHVETSDKRDSPTSSSTSTSAKISEKQDSSMSSELDELGIPKRFSVGRPLRKAAEKVSSYKEINLNVKLRRPG
ncbi:shugoshin-1-like isoform X3 [Zingiber officinale]|uniref:shugoshin-1-like isoform X3 n=1 Tax=Zingiber officinale TaxID=94328 RepID=UPI001C4C7D04|nr:shugoshin-1-like isoform X3 [Zingiber officinale]